MPEDADRFVRFRRAVLDERELEQRLRALDDWATFAAVATAEAGARGIELTTDELEAERRRAQLGWPTRALAGLTAVAGKTGQRLPGGGLMVPSARYPKSVHLACPDGAYEIEVFDPVPGQARTIALSGQVRPIR